MSLPVPSPKLRLLFKQAWCRILSNIFAMAMLKFKRFEPRNEYSWFIILSRKRLGRSRIFWQLETKKTLATALKRELLVVLIAFSVARTTKFWFVLWMALQKCARPFRPFRAGWRPWLPRLKRLAALTRLRSFNRMKMRFVSDFSRLIFTHFSGGLPKGIAHCRHVLLRRGLRRARPDWRTGLLPVQCTRECLRTCLSILTELLLYLISHQKYPARTVYIPTAR